MTTMTNAQASPVTPAPARGGLRLSGLNWLVWRQHRATYWTLIVGTVLAVGWVVYQRGQMIDSLHALGWPNPKSDDAVTNLGDTAFTMTAFGLGFIPIVIGVFVGAPLIAGDLESGTAKLVTSQSVSRVRWIVTKFGVTVLLVAVGTIVLAGVFGWWWSPVKDGSSIASWIDGGVFDNTGPVLTALTLFTLVGGVAIGMVLRRTLLSMAVTFGFAVAVQIIWSYFRLDLGNARSLITNKGVLGESMPTPPGTAYELDRWFTTASGKVYGWGTCVTDGTKKQVQSCLDTKGIVGWRVDYLSQSQMPSMQWFGASILLALTVALTAFIFVWGRKRIL